LTELINKGGSNLNKKGFFTLEAMFSTLLIMIIMLTVANSISINVARSKISHRIEVLTVEASQNGGVLASDYNDFLDYLDTEGYDTTNVSIKVKRVDESDGSLEGDYFLPNLTSSYVSINDLNNQLQISISIPYKSSQIFYITFQDFDFMQFERRIISRRV
jgi:hypothetical protein